MAKKKTRIVVEIGDELKRVFTIYEKPSGGLTLVIPSKQTYGSLRGKQFPIEEHRYSIHLSENSSTGAHTVHCTTVFSGGEEKDVHLLTHAVRDHRYQPIIVKSLLDPRLSPPVNPDLRDNIINLGSFNPDAFELLYSIWISSLQAADGFPQDPRYSCKTLKFKRFSLFLPFVFAPNPSGPVSVQHAYGTTDSEKITGEAVALGHKSGPAVGAKAEQAFHTIITDFQRLKQLPLRGEWMTPGPPSPLLWSQPLGFMPKPKP